MLFFGAFHKFPRKLFPSVMPMVEEYCNTRDIDGRGVKTVLR